MLTWSQIQERLPPLQDAESAATMRERVMAELNNAANELAREAVKEGRLGDLLHNLGQYAAAIEVFERARAKITVSQQLCAIVRGAA